MIHALFHVTVLKIIYHIKSKVVNASLQGWEEVIAEYEAVNKRAEGVSGQRLGSVREWFNNHTASAGRPNCFSSTITMTTPLGTTSSIYMAYKCDPSSTVPDITQVCIKFSPSAGKCPSSMELFTIDEDWQPLPLS